MCYILSTIQGAAGVSNRHCADKTAAWQQEWYQASVRAAALLLPKVTRQQQVSASSVADRAGAEFREAATAHQPAALSAAPPHTTPPGLQHPCGSTQCQWCSGPQHCRGCQRLATAATSACRCAGDVCAPDKFACHWQPGCALLPAQGKGKHKHVPPRSRLYGRHRQSWLPVPAGCREEAGPGPGQGGQAGAADEPRAAQRGARKRSADSQQDGAAQGRLNKRSRGPQQVQLLCLVHQSASLA